MAQGPPNLRKADHHRHGQARSSRAAAGLSRRWQVAPWPGSTYPLVLHGLLGLLQCPLHFLYGHHLTGSEGVSSARPRQKPWW